MSGYDPNYSAANEPTRKRRKKAALSKLDYDLEAAGYTLLGRMTRITDGAVVKALGRIPDQETLRALHDATRDAFIKHSDECNVALDALKLALSRRKKRTRARSRLRRVA